MRAYDAQRQVAHATAVQDARTWWLDGAWARLTPCLQGWAAMGVPGTLALSGDDVDDVVAKVVVRAWMATTVPDDPAGWCRRVARNAALDLHKKKRSEALPDEIEDPHAEQPFESLDADEYHLRVGRLRQALRQLPDPIRRCVVLHYLHGQSHNVVAATLGITVGCSKMRTHRGVVLLREVYQRQPALGLNQNGTPRTPRGRPPRAITWRELHRKKARPAAVSARTAAVSARKALIQKFLGL
jgi:RNA polymerase sigma-70 factor (ECF subfamily)